MLNIGRRRRIVALAGRDEQSRGTLAEVGVWRRAFSSSVQIIFVTEAGSPSRQELDRFRGWAAQNAKLELTPEDVVAYSASDLVMNFEDATRSPGDLLVYPANPDLSTAIRLLPIHALWYQAARLGASLLLSRRGTTMRRVLVVSDGTPRTVPVLQAAFELAERFDVQLSHLDSLHMPVPLSMGAEDLQRRRRTQVSEGADEYLRVVHGVLAAVKRAQRDVRPDLLLIGASAAEGGGTASALSSSSLPCSVLIIPL